MEERTKVRKLLEQAARLARRSRSMERLELDYEKGSLLSKQSVVMLSSFMEAMCECDGVLVEDLY